MMRLVLVSLLVLFCSACDRKHPDPSMGLNDDRAIEGVPSRYRPIYDGFLGYREDGSRDVLPFESITLERTACFGSCPVYKVTLFRNGEARLEAEAHMPLNGVYRGKIDIRTFARICFVLERFGFASFKADYQAPWTDSATCIVTVRTKRGEKSVSDYGEVGPIELWAIQSAIDRVRESIHWTPVGKQDLPPADQGRGKT